MVVGLAAESGIFDPEMVLAGATGLAGREAFALTGYWAAFMTAFIGLAAYVFRRREF